MVLTRHDQRTSQRPGAATMGGGMSAALAVLVWVVAGLALAASVAGLALEGLYTGPRSTAENLRGFDLATAVVVAPSLAVAAWYARRGSLLAHLTTAGLLSSLVYTYAFFVFGTGFNDLYLLHVVVFSTSLTALVLTLATLGLPAVAVRFGGMRRVWPVAAALGLLAVSLGAMWVGSAVVNAVTGDVPVGSRLVETPLMIHVALALDLGLQVPLYGAAAVLLLRRHPWGYVLAFVALVSGVPAQLSYVVSAPLQVAAGVPGAVGLDPLEPVIAALYVVPLVVMLLGARHPSKTSEGARVQRRSTPT